MKRTLKILGLAGSLAAVLAAASFTRDRWRRVRAVINRFGDQLSREDVVGIVLYDLDLEPGFERKSNSAVLIALNAKRDEPGTWPWARFQSP